MQSRGALRGFTLIELSIVLVVIALITAMGITSGMGALAQAKLAQTQKKLDIIEAALATYRANNNRLPCPADATSNTGAEAANPGNCTSGSPAANYGTAGGPVEGAVPIQALNLTSDFMFDGWGRKFAYAVDSNATEYNAFYTINVGDSCGITVNDAGGTARTTGAMYTLLSFGPDGHGGYLATGSRMVTGSADGDQQTNCHCTAAGAANSYTGTYVQKETISTFDDIVRYKMRWHMLNSEDQRSLTYIGPQLLAGFSSGNTDTYKLQCGLLKRKDDLGITNATGVTFLPSVKSSINNAYALVTYGASPYCKVYPINSDGTLNTTAVVGNLNLTCPSAAGQLVAASSNGYVAMTQSGSPYIKVWQQSSTTDNFQPISFMSGSIVNPTPIASLPTSLTISNHYLAVSDRLSGSINLFKLLGNSVTSVALPTGGSGPPGATTYYSSALSPDDYYLGLATVNAGKPRIYLWRLNNATVAAATGSPYTINTGDTSPVGLAFAPHSQYMVMGSDGGSSDAVIASIDPLTDSVNTTPLTLTGLTNGASNVGTAFSFSPDGNYIAMSVSGQSGTNSLALLRQTSANTFKFAVSPDLAPGTSNQSVSFNH